MSDLRCIADEFGEALHVADVPDADMRAPTIPHLGPKH
jgi:hypothetical protein